MYYIKKSFPYLLVLLFTDITGYSIICLEKVAQPFPLILSFLNLAVYVAMFISIAFKEGQDAYKVRIANDLERKQIILTGEDRPLRIHEEYTDWKGFVVGLVSASPIILLTLLHLIFSGIFGTMHLFGDLLGYFSMCFYTPIYFIFGNFSVYYCGLLAVICIALVGGSFYLGGKKIELQQQKIKEIQNEIYGK